MKVLVTKEYLTNIANSIRGKKGNTTKYKPEDMSEAIDSITTTYSPRYISFREYKGIDLETEKEVFNFSFPEGTNNIGEFLAIVHWLSWLKSEKKADYSLYSDSRNAIGRVREKKCKTNYVPKDEKFDF